MSDEFDADEIQSMLDDAPPEELPDDFDADMPAPPTERPAGQDMADIPPNAVFLAGVARLLAGHKNELTAAVQQTIRQTLAPQPREPKEGEPPPMPVLPDGTGMSLEQVQNLLAEKHKTIVSLDDPVLMLVTVMNAFLAEENALLERHKTAMAKVLADKTGEYVGAVKSVTDSLSKALADVTLTAMQQTFAGHRLELEKHKRNIMWLSAIAAISALVNVAVFVWRAIR